MGDIGKGTTMDKGCGMLGRLHEVGLHGIHQQNQQGSHTAHVAHVEWLAFASDTQQDVLQAAAQVIHIGGKTEDGHDL